jgi:gp16 family phage-associated protein
VPRKVLTLQEVREGFVSRGETMTAWAAAHGFRRDLVYSMVNGRLRGRWGTAHRLAVELGLKLEPEPEPGQPSSSTDAD